MKPPRQMPSPRKADPQMEGSNDSDPERMIQVFFGNISTWGPQAESYLEGHTSDILLEAESHLEAGAFNEGRSKYGDKGWEMIGPLATPAGHEGNQGGTIVFGRSLPAKCPGFQSEQQAPTPGVGKDWKSVNLRWQRSSGLIGTNHLDSRHGGESL